MRRQAPAGHHRPVLNQPVSDNPSHQFAIISGFQLSAIFTKPSAGNPAAATNPHRQSSVHRFPAGSFFRGFRTPALYRIDRSCSGRHPKPFRLGEVRQMSAIGTSQPIGFMSLLFANGWKGELLAVISQQVPAFVTNGGGPISSRSPIAARAADCATLDAVVCAVATSSAAAPRPPA
jgi:hypothetical protein